MWYWFLIPLSIFLCFFLLRLLFWRRWGWGWGYGCGYGAYGPYAAADVSADEILRRRLARGEIDEAAYERLAAALKK